MNLLNGVVGRISAALIVCVMLCFTHSALAKPVPSTPPFDHSKTGFLLRDVHYILKCEQCHVEGIFKNTPKVCSGCHTTGTRVAAKPKPINHVPTNGECDSCHISASSFQVNSYKHDGVNNNCVYCHSGSYLGVLGKSATHIPTAEPCESCHTNTSTFISWRMNHTNNAGDCASCHGGPNAIITYPEVTTYNQITHPPLASSTQACTACHSGNNFTSFIASLGGKNGTDPLYKHVGIVSGTCGTCHLNQNANVVSLPAVHIPQSHGNACDDCHKSRTTFAGTVFDHSTTTAECANCHTSQYSGVKSIDTSTHMTYPAGTSCGSCHTSFTTFLGAIYNHAGVTAACSTCHSGQYIGVKSINTSTHVAYPASIECSSCHRSYSTFLGASYNHSSITAGCSTCHSGQSAGVKSINPATHFAYSAGTECGACHKSFTTFAGTVYDHSTITLACSNCHSGLVANVKSINTSTHIAYPASMECGTCHKSFATFAGTVYDHSTITAACSTCHSGQATGVTSINPSTHIPFAAGTSCATCHAGYTSFTGGTFSHTSTTAACATCHSGQYTGVVSINPAVHIPLPSGATCDTCHGQPSAVSPTFLGMVFHTNSLGSGTTAPAGMTCATCHSGAYISENAKGTGTTHVPTATDCVTCHTKTNTLSYTTFLNATFSHSGISAGTCGTCHKGQYGGVVSINPAIHIPQSSGDACDACHTNTITGLLGATTPTFLNVVFHKNALGNPPTATCATCHSGGYLSENAQAKNLGHVPTATDCVICHTATNTSGYQNFLNAGFVHSGTYASFPTAIPATPTCTSCHNGTTAQGKDPVTHVATTGDCIACHVNSTTSCPNCATFFGVQYDHTNATRGIAAYTTFPAVGATPSPRCDSCHGSTAKAKTSTTHVPTTLDCMTCHTPTSTGCGATGICSSFLGATFTHQGVAAGSCGTCHRGQYASVVSINNAVHIPQSQGNACDTCHTNAITGLSTTGASSPKFTNVVYHQNSLGHSPSATCTSCHSGAYVSQNALAKNTGHVTTTDDCVVCHTATNTTNYTNFLNAAFPHSPGTYATFPAGSPASPLCSACHGSTAKGKNTGHVSTTTDCIDCHINSTTGCPNCSTFLGATTSGPHTIASGSYNGTCVSCHNGSTAKGLSANPNHIKTPGSVDCQVCHPAYDGVGSIDFSTAANAGAGLVGTVTKYTMNHTVLTDTCTSCHSGSYVTQGVFGALAKPAKHIPTTITGSLDCTTCHTTLTGAGIKVTSGAADWVKEKMNHNGATGSGAGGVYCVTCHLSGASYLGSADKKSHKGAGLPPAKDCGGVSGCHKPSPGTVGTLYTVWPNP